MNDRATQNLSTMASDANFINQQVAGMIDFLSKIEEIEGKSEITFMQNRNSSLV